VARPSIPFDTSSTIRDGLRSEANDPVSMAAAVDWLEHEASSATSIDDRTWLLGQAGACAGILRQLTRADASLREAITLADDHGLARRSVVLRIRLADILALGGDPDGAIALTTALLDDTETLPDDLEDFVHQHLAKALIEAGRTDEAVTHLERALELRERKGDPELLASTRTTLDLARQVRGENAGPRPAAGF
jgi:tetratricopeptide (TPR) repeat protein